MIDPQKKNSKKISSLCPFYLISAKKYSKFNFCTFISLRVVPISIN